MQDLEQAVRERAYHLWVADGRPEGNADVYWLSAQREILTTSLSSTETAASPSKHPVSATTKPVKRLRSPDREKANFALHRFSFAQRNWRGRPSMFIQGAVCACQAFLLALTDAHPGWRIVPADIGATSPTDTADKSRLKV